MARDFESGSSQYGTVALPNLTSRMSMGVWLTAESITTFQTIISKGDSGNDNDRNFGFDYRAAFGPKLEVYWTQPASTFVEHYKVITLTADTWYHILWVIDWTTNPDTVTLYVNGVSQSLTLVGSNNSTPSTGGTQVTKIGSFHNAGNYWDGKMAEMFVASVAVDAGQASALAKGYAPPSVISAGGIEGYWPMIGKHSPEIDPVKGRSVTLVNSPTAAAHPRVIYPRRRTVLAPVATAPPGGLSIPVAMYSYRKRRA